MNFKANRDPKRSVQDLMGIPIQSVIPEGTVTAITKLSDSMIAHQQLLIKIQEEKTGARVKAWRRLPAI